MNSVDVVDVIIIGAGASGLVCAAEAARHGNRVVVIDHASRVGAKVLISGGGRCNFTNRTVAVSNYVSGNHNFVRSALSRFTPEHFLEWVKEARISFHERDWGQLFCDHSAGEIVHFLEKKAHQNGATFLLNTKIDQVSRSEEQFIVHTSRGEYRCARLVLATGGLSFSKVGASSFGYKIAQQFGHTLVPTHPVLVGLTFGGEAQAIFNRLSGIAIRAEVKCKKQRFVENVLMTHSGLSGPALLQASLYWSPGEVITINWLPQFSLFDELMKRKKLGDRSLVKNLLALHLPARMVEALCADQFTDSRPLPQVSEKLLAQFCMRRIHQYEVIPSGTFGYDKAEATRGGVNTDEISSKTFESKCAPGLYLIGELLDVTGQLGGYNLHWAWASGYCAGVALAAR